MIEVQLFDRRGIKYAWNGTLSTALRGVSCFLFQISAFTFQLFSFSGFSFSSAPCLVLGVPGTVPVWRGQPHNVHP